MLVAESTSRRTCATLAETRACFGLFFVFATYSFPDADESADAIDSGDVHKIGVCRPFPYISVTSRSNSAVPRGTLHGWRLINARPTVMDRTVDQLSQFISSIHSSSRSQPAKFGPPMTRHEQHRLPTDAKREQ
jgi:hypothetical protein